MEIKKHIPNLLTLVNALCGGLALFFIMRGEINTACMLVVLGAFVDFFDGFVARALKVTSEIGKQLDSLSDVITFGVVPAFLAHHMFASSSNFGPEPSGIYHLFEWVPFLIIPFSAYRLGKFNIDTRQTTSFLGLPTPANAVFWVGLAWNYNIFTYGGGEPRFPTMPPWIILALSLIFSILLVTEIPLFALKFKGFGWKGNEVKFVFLGLSLLLLIGLQVMALPLIIILYIVLSIINNLLTRNHELRS